MKNHSEVVAFDGSVRPIAQTLDPYAVSPTDMQELISLQVFLDSSELGESLMELLRLHVSGLNGCAQGVYRHRRRLSSLGEAAEKLTALAMWRGTRLFTEKERAALEWSEAVTSVARVRVSTIAYAGIRQWFTDIEIVKLTMVIATTIAWNHVEMTFPPAYGVAE